MGCGSSSEAVVVGGRRVNSSRASSVSNTQDSRSDIKTYDLRDISYHLATNEGRSLEWKKQVYGEDYVAEQTDALLARIKMATDSWRKMDIERFLSRVPDDADWWNIVPKICSKKPLRVQPDKKRKTWKTVRLFVSSTFRDMQNERELLVKRVFPQLRAWCEKRKLRLIECDLRWGIPKNADSRQVLGTCLAEIDRCGKENGQPYFLGLLSERYGWVPENHEIPDDLQKTYKYVPGLSITAWEVMTGAFWDHNPNALICLRKPECLNSMKDSGKQQKIVFESSQDKKKSIAVLKDKLTEYFPKQVYNYRCHVASKDPFQLTELDELAEIVLTFFKQRLNYQYPPLDGADDFITQQYKQHEIFMVQCSQVVLGRGDIIKRINGYVEGSVDGVSNPLVIAGSPGAGKSAVLSYTTQQYLKNNKNHVFFHFVGSPPGSMSLTQLMTRMWAEILPNETPPGDTGDLNSSMYLILKHASVSKMKKKLIIVIDAVDQLDMQEISSDLNWLPRELPKNIRVIVSTSTLDIYSLNQIENVVDIESLDVASRKEIVVNTLLEFGKKLDETQLNNLVMKSEAGRPLYLAVAVEELRVFGLFEKVDSMIKSFPNDLNGLMKQVIGRIASEIGELVIATLCLLETSKWGLLETELIEMLVYSPLLPNSPATKSEFDKLPMGKWSPIFFALRPFLQPSGSLGEGRLNFFHQSVSRIVRDLFLKSSDAKKFWHKRFVDYFTKSSDMERKSEELPFHLVQIGDKQGLKSCILHKEVFDNLYTESRKFELMKYWRICGGYSQAPELYITSYNQYLQELQVDNVDQVASAQVKLCWFFIDIAQYVQAEQLLTGVVQILVSKYGSDAPELMDPYYALVVLKLRQALEFNYNTDAGYRQCHNVGVQFATECARIFQMYRSSKDLLLGKVLAACGYFLGEKCLLVARKILEACESGRSLVDVLVMLGEKNQYHSDIEVPKKYFDEALELSLSHFGRNHTQTARCYQLYAQFHWNLHVIKPSGGDKATNLRKALELYENEFEIQKAIVGREHPAYKRAEQNVNSLKNENSALKKRQFQCLAF
ncbi:TPR repeat-containing protein DDB_G0287407-like [Tubulanus polymorphus]|uniref:TPR repeat-containing protein DDB_G0287407-like n=1 Tax=Tubulanus polymorphus TaxID=672921 RepID=UPI003DA6C858